MSLRLRRDLLLRRGRGESSRSVPPTEPGGQPRARRANVSTGIGVLEALARFELLSALEQDSTSLATKLDVLLPRGVEFYG
jgi:hypothetical protein